MNRLIHSSHFREFRMLNSTTIFNAFNQVVCEILDLNNNTFNPVLRSNILCRTKIELAILQQAEKNKKKL